MKNVDKIILPSELGWKKSIKAITLHMKMTARKFKVPDINSKPKVTVIAIWAKLIEEG